MKIHSVYFSKLIRTANAEFFQNETEADGVRSSCVRHKDRFGVRISDGGQSKFLKSGRMRTPDEIKNLHRYWRYGLKTVYAGLFMRKENHGKLVSLFYYSFETYVKRDALQKYIKTAASEFTNQERLDER